MAKREIAEAKRSEMAEEEYEEIECVELQTNRETEKEGIKRE